MEKSFVIEDNTVSIQFDIAEGQKYKEYEEFYAYFTGLEDYLKEQKAIEFDPLNEDIVYNKEYKSCETTYHKIPDGRIFKLEMSDYDKLLVGEKITVNYMDANTLIIVKNEITEFLEYDDEFITIQFDMFEGYRDFKQTELEYIMKFHSFLMEHDIELQNVETEQGKIYYFTLPNNKAFAMPNEDVIKLYAGEKLKFPLTIHKENNQF
jgi:hypothetical protein